MPDSVMNAEELFPFRHLARALEGFTVPTAAFDPLGTWTSTYDLVERAFKTVTLGALELERRPDGQDRAILRVQQRKHAGGGVGRARGEIRCAVDVLASPLAWTLESWITDPQGHEIEETRLNEAVEVRDGALCRTCAGHERRQPAPGPLALDWGLFDAVQRLPRAAPTEQRFTLIDRLGACLKPDHVLVSSRSVTVRLGGHHVWGEQAEPLAAGTRYRPSARIEGATEVLLHEVVHTGRGILPTTYWVDDAGRLLFVLSGMMAWILNPKAQV